MKNLIAFIVAVLLAPAAYAQRVDRPLTSKLDLDTPTIAATTNRIVTSVNLTNVALTIAAQPDVPRNLTGTVTDTTPSVVAGTVTFVGTDINGAALTEVWNFATALTFTGTKLFATVTSATVAAASVLGGAGDETIVVGVGSVVAYRYCSLSDPLSGDSGGRIETSSSSTTVTAVSGTPFTAVAVGDEITASGPAGQFTRVITAKASSISLTVDSAVNLDVDGGYGWTFRTLTCGYGDTAGWIRMVGRAHSVAISIRQRTATGGIDYSIETRPRSGLGLPLQVLSGNLTGELITGVRDTTAANSWEITDTAAEVRVGLKFGTTDDSSDTGPEMVDVVLTTEAK